MAKKRNAWKRILLLLAAVFVSVNLTLLLSGGPVYGLNGDEGAGKTVLAFTSDIHNNSDNIAANRLDAWLDKVEDKYGHVDVMSFCGDMGSARANEEQFWSYTSSVMGVVDGESIPGVYTTGNHEFYNGLFGETQNSVRGVYKVGEVGKEGSNYTIYCLGTDNWNDRRDNYPESQIESLKAFLDGAGDDKPIIILTHFPLHVFGSGRMVRNTTNAGLVIDALNDAAADGKKIVLLWGHNHTVNDTYYDQIYAPGDSIEYESGSSKELQFYYGAAGCMSDSEYGSGSAFVKGKGLVITIDDDRNLSFTYYDANANNVTEGGTYSEVPVQATGLVIDESVEEGADGQPVTVGQTIAAGKKLQLHLTVEPETANRKGLFWSSSDEAVATVTQSGLVKGVSEGRVTITATIPATDQTEEISASIEITVGQRDKAPVFVLTDKLEPGKNYIIVNKATGTAYALTNDNGSAGVTEVKIDGDRITADDEEIILTAEGSDGVVANFRNEESYLQVGMGRMSFAASGQGGRPWTYGDDKKLSCQGSRNSYYLYHDGSNYIIGFDEAAAGEVYLFVQTDNSPEPDLGKTTAYITYKLGGGTYNGSAADIVEKHKTGDVITVHEAPERKGYTFSYWKGSEYRPGDTYTVSGDHTFTAVWKENGKNEGAGGSSGNGGRPHTGDRGYSFYLLVLIASAAALAAMLASRAIRSARSKG